jgi:cell division protein FtsW (lipid II flippase)
MISRLNHHLARTQAVWTGVGVGAFVVTLAVVRRSRFLERYRYTFALLGFFLLVLPLAPGIGATINGARLWVHVGPINFEPNEIAKVLLVIFFASYLADKRELLSTGSRRIGQMMIPDPKHLLPLILAWGFSLIIMAGQGDLGSSMLFFAVFVGMLYVATERSAYLLGAAGLFTVASVFAYNAVGHVQVRVSTWINPWPVSQGKGYQLIQSLFAFGSGGFGAPVSVSAARRRSPTPRPTSCSPPSARSWVCSAPSPSSSPFSSWSEPGSELRCRATAASRSCSRPGSPR